MPWKDKSITTMREEFVKRVLSHEKSKSALCCEYGISRPTGDKWIRRFIEGESLSDRSRAPEHPHMISPEIESFIVDYRKKYPAIGAIKIHRMLRDQGVHDIPSPRTINEIFRRNGLISPEASQAATPYCRFEKDSPNEMWQADFKGHFLLENGHRCHPLDIIDDHSRFCLCCAPLRGETFAEVKPQLIRVFREYGMPRIFLCDNGNPWGVQQSDGFTQFEVWLMDLGILTVHGRVRHPQTQGKQERFNGTLTRELLKYHSFADEEDAEIRFAEYREFYNNERPHHALKLDTPASHYTVSERKYPEVIHPWVYPPGCVVRRVNNKGFVRIFSRTYFLSEAFIGRQVAIRQSVESSTRIDIFYRQFRIAQLDLNEQDFLFKRAYLISNDPRFPPSTDTPPPVGRELK